MEKKEPLHPDVGSLIQAANFIIRTSLSGGEIYWTYKPGEKGRLDIKLYGYTTGELTPQ